MRRVLTFDHGPSAQTEAGRRATRLLESASAGDVALAPASPGVAGMELGDGGIWLERVPVTSAAHHRVRAQLHGAIGVAQRVGQGDQIAVADALAGGVLALAHCVGHGPPMLNPPQPATAVDEPAPDSLGALKQFITDFGQSSTTEERRQAWTCLQRQIARRP